MQAKRKTSRRPATRVLKTRNERRLVIVEWSDAWSNGTWTQLEAEEKPITVHSVGWLIQSNRNGITLCSRLTEDGSIGVKHFIPKGMVVKVTELIDGKFQLCED